MKKRYNKKQSNLCECSWTKVGINGMESFMLTSVSEKEKENADQTRREKSVFVPFATELPGLRENLFYTTIAASIAPTTPATPSSAKRAVGAEPAFDDELAAPLLVVVA